MDFLEKQSTVPLCCFLPILVLVRCECGFGGWIGLINREVYPAATAGSSKHHFSSDACMKQVALLNWRWCHVSSWIYHHLHLGRKHHTRRALTCLLNEYFHNRDVGECVCVSTFQTLHYIYPSMTSLCRDCRTNSLIWHYWCFYNVNR